MAESSAALADLNGDGVSDVVVCSGDGTVCALSWRDGSRLWAHRKRLQERLQACKSGQGR